MHNKRFYHLLYHRVDIIIAGFEKDGSTEAPGHGTLFSLFWGGMTDNFTQLDDASPKERKELKEKYQIASVLDLRSR